MRYRKLDANGDMTFGRNQDNIWRDVPDAVGQAVLTRLRLQQGDWFLDRREGTPWKTKVLGKYTQSTKDPVIRARIVGTRGVSRLLAYASQTVMDPDRTFHVQATIDTIYGRVVVKGPI
jgi:hypothetical protein